VETGDAFGACRNNFGLLESRRTALRSLRCLHSATSARGRILAESLDFERPRTPTLHEPDPAYALYLGLLEKC
jgi:hypothetical protein